MFVYQFWKKQSYVTNDKQLCLSVEKPSVKVDSPDYSNEWFDLRMLKSIGSGQNLEKKQWNMTNKNLYNWLWSIKKLMVTNQNSVIL